MPATGVPNYDNMKKLLSAIGMSRWNNPSPYAVTTEDKNALKKMQYVEKYILYYKKKYYSFLLNDLSIVGFETASSGFFYFQVPFSNMEEYLQLYDLNKTEYIHDLDFMLDDLLPMQHPFYSRYDYAEEQYTEGRHPVAHIHLGVNTSMRVACQCKLQPMSFVLFVLRQFYPEKWEQMFNATEIKSQRANILKSVRENLSKVSSDFMKEKDLYEMYFA